MRHHISHLTVALATAALAVGCTGRTSSVQMSQERTDSALKANDSPSMTLIGCVKPAPNQGEGRYILDHVTMPPGELQPESASSAAALVPRGSWVRLGGPDMHQYLGKEVLVSGNLAEMATGTAGHAATEPPGDYVRWNETPASVPLFAAERVKVQADKCGS
jgi:hypothetical protein